MRRLIAGGAVVPVFSRPSADLLAAATVGNLSEDLLTTSGCDADDMCREDLGSRLLKGVISDSATVEPKYVSSSALLLPALLQSPLS